MKASIGFHGLVVGVQRFFGEVDQLQRGALDMQRDQDARVKASDTVRLCSRRAHAEEALRTSRAPTVAARWLAATRHHATP